MPFDPHNYVRYSDGDTRGGGTHTNVVQYKVASGEGSHIQYLAIGDDQGAFKINDSGVYAVSMTGGSANSFTMAIKSGAAVDNTLADATQRAALDEPAGGGLASISWVGKVEKDEFIWFIMDADPSAVAADNQVSIVQVA